MCNVEQPTTTLIVPQLIELETYTIVIGGREFNEEWNLILRVSQERRDVIFYG